MITIFRRFRPIFCETIAKLSQTKVNGIFWQYFESESPLLLTICCPKNIKNICNIDPESDLPFQSYLANDRRHNYTTPKSYLELINLYVKVPILRIYVQAEKLTYKY
jgi:hypothetical protein